MSIEKSLRIIKDAIEEGSSSYDLLRSAAHFRRLELEKKLHAQLKGRICDGPFAGILYPSIAISSTLLPKLLGTYEKEIQSLIITLANKADTFLDIGCAEGYYTTCMAARTNISKVVGVDRSTSAVRAAKESAELNQCHHKCVFTQTLSAAVPQISGKILIMIDVDGNELDVIDELSRLMPEEALAASSIIVETDYDTTGSNKNAIIAKLGECGARLSIEIKQKPSMRLSPIAQSITKSMLDLTLYGLEGRPLDQSWLVFGDL